METTIPMNKSQAPRLSTATTTNDISEATARWCWHEEHGDGDCPLDKIPSEVDLLDFAATQKPTPGASEATNISEAIMAELFPEFTRWVWLENVGYVGIDEDAPADKDKSTIRGQLAAVGFGPPGQFATDRLRLYSLEEIQTQWKQKRADKGKDCPQHPLAPIVAAWQNPPKVVAANLRDDPLFPAPTIMVKPNSERGQLFSPAAHIATRHSNRSGVMYCPGFAPGEPESGPITPALPLALYDLGAGAGEVSQRAAPLALRMFVEACLSVPVIERDNGKPVLLPAERLGDYLKRLYPDGSKNWRAQRYLPRLYEAFEALVSPQARIPWQNEQGEGAARLVVIPMDVPRSGKLDDWVRFQVNLPPGSERGPLVDRPTLIRAGAQSATRYRLALSLSFWWFYPGRLQRPLANGGPWALPKEGSRYPEVADLELVSMAFPADGKAQGATYRKRLERANQALGQLVTEGFAAVAQDRRIYPGKAWTGWGKSA